MLCRKCINSHVKIKDRRLLRTASRPLYVLNDFSHQGQMIGFGWRCCGTLLHKIGELTRDMHTSGTGAFVREAATGVFSSFIWTSSSTDVCKEYPNSHDQVEFHWVVSKLTCRGSASCSSAIFAPSLSTDSGRVLMLFDASCKR